MNSEKNNKIYNNNQQHLCLNNLYFLSHSEYSACNLLILSNNLDWHGYNVTKRKGFMVHNSDSVLAFVFATHVFFFLSLQIVALLCVLWTVSIVFLWQGVVIAALGYFFFWMSVWMITFLMPGLQERKETYLGKTADRD